MRFADYEPGDFFDEMFGEPAQPRVRPRARSCSHRRACPTASCCAARRRRARAAQHGHHLQRLRRQRRHRADLALRHRAADRRGRASGSASSAGSKQRIHALNLFIDDIYHEQKILKDGVVPREHRPIGASPSAQPCVGLKPPRGIWCHITGTDLVRDSDGQIYVLEDNLRCPSGVSYVLENRAGDEAHVPAGLRGARASARSTTIPSRLLDMLQYLCAAGVDDADASSC